MDNDAIHKFAYRHREMVADLLRLAVPALAAELDLAAAKEISPAHVGHRAGALEQRYGDMIWRVPFKTGALKDGSRPYLLVLLEFQSTVNRNMPRRMRNYGLMLRERLVADGTAEREGGLPWLLPLVLYNGSERWTAAGHGAGLVAAPSATAWRTLALYQPEDYVLFSLERLKAAGGRSLPQLPLANRAAATMRLQLGRTPKGIEQRLRTEWARFPGASNDATRRVLHTWAQTLVADMAEEDGTVPTLPSFEELSGRKEKEMTTITQAGFREWRRSHGERHEARGVRKGIEQGIEQGVKQGIEQGVKQGIQQERRRNAAMVRRLAAIKFGAQTADNLVTILGAAPTAERMDRVGVAIMECDSGAELLARCSEAEA